MDIVINGNINGHLGSDMTEYEKIHWNYGFGDLIEKVIEFVQTYKLAVMNNFYRKREVHYIIIKSGRNRSHRFFLYREERI